MRPRSSVARVLLSRRNFRWRATSQEEGLQTGSRSSSQRRTGWEMGALGVAHMREYKKVQPGYMSTFVPRCNLDMAEGYKKVQHPLKGCTLYPMAEAPRWAAIGDALWHEKPGFALDNGEWVPRG